MSNPKPLIGITCGEIHNKIEPWSPVAYGQSRTYVDSIIRAGGVPVLLPLTESEPLLHRLCDMLDGICLAGGNDLDPGLYGQQPVSATNDYSDLRDKTEQIILARMLGRHRPVLGICRGMQLLNVYHGGTLHQDIAADVPGSLDHNASTKLKTLTDLSHTLRIEPNSLLAGIVGPEPLGANAHHHQSVDRLGEGMRATAWTNDGVIEAIELSDYPYAIGVQLHPESLTEIEPRWAKLFSSFVQAAGPKP